MRTRTTAILALALSITLGAFAARARAGDDLVGTWVWEKDSDGAQPGPGAVIRLRFLGGGVTMIATQADGDLTFAGTYRLAKGKLTLAFTEDPGGGQHATDAAYAVQGTSLTLPFGIARPESRSTWRRLKDVRYGKIERGACPASGIACNVPSLGSFVMAGDCMFDVAYQGGVELERRRLCTLTCADAKLEVQNDSCNQPAFACQRGFLGKKSWSNFADLDPQSRTRANELFGKVAVMASASWVRQATMKTEADLNAFANQRDPARDDVEGKLTELLMSKMAPYDWACSNATERGKVPWRFTAVYARAPQIAVQGESPMGFLGPDFKIYYSAFVKKVAVAGKVTFTPVAPEETVASYLHELVHMGQPDHGMGDAPALQDTQMHLSEIEAYARSREHLFYRHALEPAQFTSLIKAGLDGQIRDFFADLPTQPKLQTRIANWAYAQPWMMIRMLRLPTNEGGVWGKLCAVPKSPCQGPLPGP